MSVDLAYLSLARENYPTLPAPIYNKPFLEDIQTENVKELYWWPMSAVSRSWTIVRVD